MRRASRRVLFLTSSAPRFAGDATAPFILNMARDLCELGWQVEILAPHAPGASKREVLDGVTIHRFQYLWPAAWQTLCYNGGAAVNLKRSRLNMLAVPFLVLAESVHGLLHILGRRPALIHSHWVIPQGFIGQLLSVLRVPHVVSVHGTDVYGFRGRLPRALKRWTLRHCDHVVANSTSTRAEVEALCTPRALSVIPTGADPFAASQAPPSAGCTHAGGGIRTILFVGRLIEAKGANHLIDAMPRILASERVRLVIVGEGPERSRLQQQALDLGIDRHCVFEGQVPPATVGDFLANADVFVGPSVSIPGESTEAQGNTFVEALLARVPVVASRVGGIPDAIIHERTGLLVQERNADQIADSVLRILTNAPFAESLKEAGRKHAMEHFSRFHNAIRLSDVYEAALAARAAA